MIDHIVYGVDDLRAGIVDLAERLGVPAPAGGKHVGAGTRSPSRLSGGGSSRETTARGRYRTASAAPVPFALARVRLPRLVGWATRVTDIEQSAQRARDRGFDPGPVHAMSRRRPDGVLLKWRLTRHDQGPGRVAVPFLIDWGDSPHPSQASPTGGTLVELRVEHPRPDDLRRALAAFDANLAVDEATEPALVATLGTPKGTVVLR